VDYITSGGEVQSQKKTPGKSRESAGMDHS